MYIYIAVLILISYYQAESCSCGEYLDVPFCGSQSQDRFIILAEVMGSEDYHSIDIMPLENLHNEIFEDSIRVLGSDGVNCGEQLDRFSTRDTLVLSLRKGDFESYDYQTEIIYNYQWYISICGTNYLKYSKEKITGTLYQENIEATVSYNSFLEDLGACISTSVEQNHENNHLSIYPNIIDSESIITININAIQEIEIVSISGNLIESISVNQTNDYKLNTSSYESGIYFVKVETNNSVYNLQFIKI